MATDFKSIPIIGTVIIVLDSYVINQHYYYSTSPNMSFILLLLLLHNADISALLAKCDDPKMAQDPSVSEVVKQLHRACTEAGFFYVVFSLSSLVLEFKKANI